MGAAISSNVGDRSGADVAHRIHQGLKLVDDYPLPEIDDHDGNLYNAVGAVDPVVSMSTTASVDSDDFLRRLWP